MIALIQRVSEANVVVDGKAVGAIGKGLLVLLGVEKGDDDKKAHRLHEKVLGYRIFEDENGKMNLNVQQLAVTCWWFPSSPWRRTPTKACAEFQWRASGRSGSFVSTVFALLP